MIYALYEPDFSECRYVGKTIRLRQRIAAHMSPTHLSKNTPKALWLMGLSSQGKRPVVVILEDVPGGENWEKAERKWIAYYRRTGHRLTNMADGGGGVPGVSLPEEARARISSANKGRKYSEEVRLRMSESKKGKKHTEEAKRKVSEFQKWFGNLPEERERRRERSKGRTHSEETKRKLSEQRKGFKFTEEARRKMSESAKRRCRRQAGESVDEL